MQSKERPQNKNLIPGGHKFTTEELQKGGRKAAEARRKRRDRKERIQAMFDTALKDPKMIKNLQNLGIEDTDGMTLEMAMDARMVLNAIRGDTRAYFGLKNEAYGPMDTKAQLELSGEITGIDINVRDFSKKKDERKD